VLIQYIDITRPHIDNNSSYNSCNYGTPSNNDQDVSNTIERLGKMVFKYWTYSLTRLHISITRIITRPNSAEHKFIG